MSNGLSERVHIAVLKMIEAKKGYTKIVDLYGDKERSTDYYKTNFSKIQQNLYSAIDILLGCFVEEKKIQTWKKDINTKKFLPCSGEVKSTNDYCSAILFYNLEHPEKQYLTDVDFAYISADKRVRNLDEHKGIQKDLQDIYRTFFNLNKVLLALDANKSKETVSLDFELEAFSFNTFDSYIGQNNEDKRLILLADSLHNVDSKELAAFLSLPWSLVLDFDGATAMGGLKSTLVNYECAYNSYSYNYVINENNTVEFFNRTIHIQMCDEEVDLRVKYDANGKRNAKDTQLINKLTQVLRDTSHPYATIVIAGRVSERINQLCTDIAAQFKQTDIVILSKQENGNVYIPEETDLEHEDENVGIISSVHQFDCSIFSAFSSIYENRMLLLNDDVLLYSDTNNYVMPNKILLDISWVERMEEEVEFLHLGLGKNVEDRAWDFFHGDIISWDAIEKRSTLPLIGNRFAVFVNEMKNAGSKKCFYIYHLPGFGGTTLGRQLVWEIHKEMPVVRLKKYKRRNDFKYLLNDLYIRFNKKPFWIFVDENSVINCDVEDIENEIRKGDYPVCALIVKRISEQEAQVKSKLIKNNEIVLNLVERNAKEILESKCATMLHNSILFNTRKKHMDDNLNEREKCPLLINLYLLEEDFKLDTYVKKCIDRIPQDYDKEKMQNLLAFLAIGSYYANVRIPSSYCKQYMNYKTADIDMSCFEGIVLKRQEGTKRLYSINHCLIAKEILIQLWAADREHWQGSLPEYVMKYIDWIKQLLCGVNAIDDDMLYIISAFFTDKTKSVPINNSWESWGNSYTSLLSEMDEYHRIDVINYLANVMSEFVTTNIPQKRGRKEYRMLAHIFAQQAKIRQRSSRIEESTDEASMVSKDDELNNYIKKTKEIIIQENLKEYALEDILARCSLERAKTYRDTLVSLDKREDVDFILQYVDDAIDHFKWTIWDGSPDYGVPGKMAALIFGLQTLIDYHGWSEKERLEKVNNDAEAKNYLEEARAAFSDIEEYDLSSVAATFAMTKKEALENILYPEKPSELLQKLDNIRSRLETTDYAGHYFVSTQSVLAYERSHYDENGRRRALVRKAINGEKKACEDAKKVFEHLDRVVRMNTSHVVSHSDYIRWFEYAKYMEVSLSRAKDVAKEWRDSEAKRTALVKGQHSTLLKPYYYLFVISLLQYKSGTDGVTAEEVWGRKQDLLGETKKVNHYRGVQDWYCMRKGLGQLYSHEWIDVKDVAEEDKITTIKGAVADFNDESGIGYIKITDPKLLGNWSKPLVGYSYNTNSYVRFNEEQTRFISKKDVGTAKEWKLKIGFSFENIEASVNSIEVLNGGRAIVIDSEEHKSSQKNKISSSTDCEKNKSTKEEIHAENKGILYLNKGQEVDFYPTKFKAKVVRGTVNGIMASINKATLDNCKKGEIKKAIESKKSIKAKVKEINSQKTGYILYL